MSSSWESFGALASSRAWKEEGPDDTADAPGWARIPAVGLPRRTKGSVNNAGPPGSLARSAWGVGAGIVASGTGFDGAFGGKSARSWPHDGHADVPITL